jgi:glucokinase
VQFDGFTGMALLLAGDIGGTNTRLRLEEFTGTGAVTLHEDTYPSVNFTHLNDIVTRFLREANSLPPVAACFAIAGPVQNDKAYVTNVPQWGELNARDMEAVLKIKPIRLINDFAAIGYGIPALQPKDLVVLQDPKDSEDPQDSSQDSEDPLSVPPVMAVLGAGTGLGEALLVWQQEHNRYEVMATEGGHADYAPRTDLEIGLLKFLRSRHDRVSVERVVSGQGIFAIYEYLRSLDLTPASAEVEARLLQPDPSTQKVDPAAVVTNYSMAQSNPDREPDPLCVQTLELFVASYGAEAGNLALKSLPYGGLYIAGGIGARLLPLLQNGAFIENFLNKGRMRTILETLRVSLIANPNVGLMGAALYAQTLI